MTRCPILTRGLAAGPGEAQETTTLVAGSSPQVRWTCSGVPSPAVVRAARRAVAALAGAAVAARSPVPPAASTWRRDIEERGDRELPEVVGMTENVLGTSKRQM